MGGVIAANRVAGVDADIDMQAVMGKQNIAWRRGLASVTGELSGLGQAGLAAGGGHHQSAVDHLIASGVAMAGATGERRGTVEEGARPGDHFGAAGGVVAAGAGGAIVLGNRVGAIERVV